MAVAKKITPAVAREILAGIDASMENAPPMAPGIGIQDFMNNIRDGRFSVGMEDLQAAGIIPVGGGELTDITSKLEAIVEGRSKS